MKSCETLQLVLFHYKRLTHISVEYVGSEISRLNLNSVNFIVSEVGAKADLLNVFGGLFAGSMTFGR